MQYEDRRFRSGGIDLFEGRHTPLDELKFAPSTHHAHPLRSWSPSCLVAEHFQRQRQRSYSFPAQLKVIVQSTANDVQMGVVKTRNDSATFKIDDLGLRPSLKLCGIINAGKFVANDHDLVGLGMPGIECRDSSVFED